jgi:hypothetical protein
MAIDQEELWWRVCWALGEKLYWVSNNLTISNTYLVCQPLQDTIVWLRALSKFANPNTNQGLTVQHADVRLDNASVANSD